MTVERIISASAPIGAQIAASIRRLDGVTLTHAKKRARQWNVKVESLIWLLNDVYDSGHVRSHAYHDCPACVVNDGLVVERLGSGLNYTPWAFTAKAKSILSITQ